MPEGFPRFTQLQSFTKNLLHAPLTRKGGVVCGVSNAAIAVRGLSEHVTLGDSVLIACAQDFLRGEVIRLQEDLVLVKPYDERMIPVLNAPVFVDGPFFLYPDISWRGRALNALGIPIDEQGPLSRGDKPMPVETYAPRALERQRISEPVKTGVKVIDIFTPLCFGQRIGIFAGSGVGKSTLLAMMSSAEHFDSVVLCLTGERGREVRDMLEDTMRHCLDKVVSVISTGDESAMMRRLCPATATTIAEYLCSLGHDVLLVVDSITRYALAAREIAIAAQEPPVVHGFPPSVFSSLPRLLERAGPGYEGSGSITGVYAVLVDGDNHNDPIADSIRGTLDGHIVLSRAIAAQGRFPAVDIPVSISRLAPLSWSKEEKVLVENLKELVVRYEETRDLRAMGAYVPGGDAVLDQAIELVPKLYKALQQNIKDAPVEKPYEELLKVLKN